MLKAYYILFYKVFRFFELTAKEGWEEWKAFALICVLQIVLLVQGLVWYTVITGISVSISNPFLVAVSVGVSVTILNYFLLLHKNQWKLSVREFSKRPIKTRRISSVLVLFFVLTIFAGLILSFVLLSKTNLAS